MKESIHLTVISRLGVAPLPLLGLGIPHHVRDEAVGVFSQTQKPKELNHI